jgi:nucleotidyltransferase/DNA polymerase involved in DNA repair
MRVGCVLIRNFAVQLARRDNPQLRDRPIVIGDSASQGKAVFDASPEAAARGVKGGMSCREAASLCPEAIFVQPDEARYEQVFEEVLSILDDFSPAVEAAELGCAYLDVTGVGDEEELAHGIGSRISRETTLSASVGISSGKFFSWLAAFSARAEAPVIVQTGKEREFVAPFSISMLPCSERTKDRLRLLGIRMIGELARFSLDAMAAHFGKEGSIMYELARGIDQSPVVPRKKPEAICGTAELDPPATTYLEMLAACEQILKKLIPQVTARRKVCREIRVRLRLPSGLAQEKRLPLKDATSVRQSLLTRLRAWLEGTTFPEPVAGLELSLLLEAESGRRLSLWSKQAGLRQELARAASYLKKRFGYQPMKKVLAVEPQPLLPERRFRLVDLDQEG